MKLTRLQLKNIRSYSSQEIHFPEGSVLLSGDVGAGKTTILLALEFAFFGLQPGQRGSSLLANGQDEGEVVLEFDVDENHVVIERMIKRNAKNINQEYAALTVNGVKEELSVTELKTRVLGLLQYPQEFIKKTNLLYRYTVYSPQEEMKSIMLDDPESRLDILRHIFGIDKYRIIQENATIVSSRLKEEYKSLSAELKAIDELKTRVSEVRAAIENLEETIDKREKTTKEKQVIRARVEEELKSMGEQIIQKKNIEIESEKTNVLLTNKIQYLADREREIRDIEKKVKESPPAFEEQTLQIVLQSLIAKNKQVETLNTQFIEDAALLKSLDLKQKEHMKNKERVFNMRFCPTCLQDVGENHKHNILNETGKQLFDIESVKKEASARINVIENKREEVKKEIVTLQARKNELEIAKIRAQELLQVQARLQECVRERDATRKDVTVLENHLKELKQSMLHFSKFDNLDRVKREELRRAVAEEHKSEIEKAEAKKEYELTKKEIARIENDISVKEKSRLELQRLQEIEKWLSEDFMVLISYIERNIMVKLREEFSILFNKWFSILTNDAFFVRLDENFTPIITQGEFELDYAFLSGGERTAIALAYRLALNQIINLVLSRIKTRDILILDEPTDGFSDAQLDKIRDILREIQVKQLIIVSHEQKIEGFVDSIIKIKKEGGFSVKEV